MSDPVLDSIDHVLHDYEVSGDAMRWTPEPRPVPTLTAGQIAAFGRAFAAVGETVNRQMRAVVKVAQQVGKAYVKFAHRVMEHDRVRCRVCRPYANPKPLAFGAEYRRRTRRRNRR